MNTTPTLKAYLEANRKLLEVSGGMPANAAITLMGIALLERETGHDDNPLTLEDLAQRLGIGRQSVSYHVRYLGAFYRRGLGGLGLVVVQEYEGDRRRKIFGLTPRGRVLTRQIAAILAKAA